MAVIQMPHVRKSKIINIVANVVRVLLVMVSIVWETVRLNSAIINSILKIIILVDYANVRGKINGRINGIELEEIQIIANANPNCLIVFILFNVLKL